MLRRILLAAGQQHRHRSCLANGCWTAGGRRQNRHRIDVVSSGGAWKGRRQDLALDRRLFSSWSWSSSSEGDDNGDETCRSLQNCEKPTFKQTLSAIQAEFAADRAAMNQKFSSLEKKAEADRAELVAEVTAALEKKAEADKAELKAELTAKAEADKAELKAELNGIRGVFTPAIVHALAETAIYNHVGPLYDTLSVKGMITNVSLERFQYKCSQLGLAILKKLLIEKETNLNKVTSMFRRTATSDEQDNEDYQAQVICQILEGLRFFVQTIPPSKLQDWPPDRNTLVHNGVFLDSLFGPFDEGRPTGDLRPSAAELADTVRAYEPADASRVEQGKREEAIRVSLNALVAELRPKMPKWDMDDELGESIINDFLSQEG